MTCIPEQNSLVETYINELAESLPVSLKNRKASRTVGKQIYDVVTALTEKEIYSGTTAAFKALAEKLGVTYHQVSMRYYNYKNWLEKREQMSSEVMPSVVPDMVSESPTSSNDQFTDTLLDLIAAAEKAKVDIKDLFSGFIPMLAHVSKYVEAEQTISLLQSRLNENTALITELQSRLASEADLSRANENLQLKVTILEKKCSELEDCIHGYVEDRGEVCAFFSWFLEKNGVEMIRSLKDFTDRARAYVDGRTGLLLTPTDRQDRQ